MGERILQSHKAQAAMEYLAIFSIALLMTIPLIIIFSTQIDTMRDDIINSQLEKIGKELSTATREVHVMGSPARKTIRATFPQGITTITINNTLITFDISTSEFSYSYIEETGINMTGSLSTHPGLHLIVLTALENGGVSIEEN